MDVTSGTASRFTFDPHNDIYPVWWPDSSRILFGSDRKIGNGFSVYQKLSNGTDPDEPLLNVPGGAVPFSTDGHFLVYRTAPGGVLNLGVLPLEGDRTPHLFDPTKNSQTQAQIAPNGRWIAYTLNESGPYEVYVRSFPTPPNQYQISKGGAIHPRWRGDGKELLYYAYDGQLMTQTIVANTTLAVGPAVPLFRPRLLKGPTPTTFFQPQYDVTRDGQQLLLNVPTEEETTPSLIVVENWTAGLKK
jgi:Tol biopolymer transport system component